MRLFMALDLEEPAKSAMTEAMEELQAKHRGQKFTKPENLHYTLKFLGEAPSAQINGIIKATELSLKNFKPFKLHAKGLGYFGSRRYAKVVWAGAHEGREELVKIASELERNLSGIRKEEREPSLHLTICRPKGETIKLIEDIEKEKSRDFGWMEVKAIKLKKSMLDPKGAVYEDVKAFALVFLCLIKGI